MQGVMRAKREGTLSECAGLRVPRKTHHVQEEQADSQEESAYTMLTLRSPVSQPFLEKVTINGIAVQVELDTGAAYSVITQPHIRRLHCSTLWNPLTSKLDTIVVIALRCVDKSQWW